MNSKLLCPKCGTYIDEHEAGRCLDAWVAVDVMRIDIEQMIRTRFIEYRRYNAGRGMSGREEYSDKYRDRMLRLSLARYSTDIAAAWQVVEKVRDSGLCPTVYWDDGDDKPDCAGWQACMAYYGNTEDEFRLYDGWASTASLASCRAAIKAVSNATNS